MPLQPGTRLGPYVIEGRLGAGGMGDVYKARDSRLDRTVAIKTIASDLIGDPDRRHRFDREARAIAALSHPNICAIFDVGQDGGLAYLVMEYLDGGTLAERLAAAARPASTHGGGAGAAQSDGHPPPARPLPVRETVGIAVQLAHALAAAHKAGIVHRDLKPANIVLLRSGSTQHGAAQVKVLDFGLARLAGSTPEPNDVWSEANLLWSHDGRRIAFWSDRDGPPDIYEQSTDAKRAAAPALFDAGRRQRDRLAPRRSAACPERPQARDCAIGRHDRREHQGSSVGERVRLRFARWTMDHADRAGRRGVADLRAAARPAGAARHGRAGRRREAAVVARRPVAVLHVRPAAAAVRGTHRRHVLERPPVALFRLERDIRDFDVGPDGQRFLVGFAPSPDFTPYRLLVNWRATLAGG